VGTWQNESKRKWPKSKNQGCKGTTSISVIIRAKAWEEPSLRTQPSVYQQSFYCAARMSQLIGGIAVLFSEVPTLFLALQNRTQILEHIPTSILLVYQQLSSALCFHLKHKLEVRLYDREKHPGDQGSKHIEFYLELILNTPKVQALFE